MGWLALILYIVGIRLAYGNAAEPYVDYPHFDGWAFLLSFAWPFWTIAGWILTPFIRKGNSKW